MKWIINFFILLIIIASISSYTYYKKHNSITTSQEAKLEIQEWAGAWLISTLRKDFLYSKYFIKMYFLFHPDKKIDIIQAGTYIIPQGKNISEIIDIIAKWASSQDIKVTLKEWWNIYDIDEYLSQNNFTETWDFIAQAKNIESYKTDFPFLENALTLEWFLYPDTYFINPNNFTVERFITLLLNNFKQKAYTPFLSTLSHEQLIQIIIFASIIEKEAFPSWGYQEKAMISGILQKRFANNWMIGADITACYAYKLTSEACKMSVSKYIYEKNDYNTRTMVWLPITPINNPHIDSIKASLNPETSEYWYYLHWKDRKIYYAKTNAEHEANKKYQ